MLGHFRHPRCALCNLTPANSPRQLGNANICPVRWRCQPRRPFAVLSPRRLLEDEFRLIAPDLPGFGQSAIRVIATLLAMFSLATALIFHSDLADQNQFIHFFKNVAMAGGLIQVAAFGGGRLTVGARR